MMSTAPDAPLSAAAYIDGVWLLRVVCPYCGHVHQHGGGRDPRPEAARAFLSDRAAHCFDRDACRIRKKAHVHLPNERGYVLTDSHDWIGRTARVTARDTQPCGPAPRPAAGSITVSPECRDGKHSNCDLDALDPITDAITGCQCECHQHRHHGQEARR